MTRTLDQDLTRVITSAVAGDDVAFARVVDAYEAEMHRICVAVCGDQATAADAVQSAWAIAWRKLDSVRQPQANRIRGGRGDDHIRGGDNALDVIYGDRGNDTINGNGGDDRLYGGPGNDHIEGGLKSGDDLIVGGLGRDVLRGEGGDDVIRGGRGRDILGGGAGDDTLAGGRGKDVLGGWTGNDTFMARDGERDQIDGGRGIDRGTWDRGLDGVTSVEKRQ